MTRAVILLAALAMLATSCKTTTSADETVCASASPSVRARLTIDIIEFDSRGLRKLQPSMSAYAVEATIDKGPGIAEKGKIWFIATPSGAVWVTNIDAFGPYDHGVILPLNDQARTIGAVVPPASAPAEPSISSPGAIRALECARSKERWPGHA